MPLHRLTAPTYFGGLPGTHDFINDPASNGDPGAPAPADGKKTSGGNEGTYFVAFGEDATSSNTNRANSALAENTDYLDDVVHADLAVPATHTATTGAPTDHFTITGTVYVGNTPLPGGLDNERILNGLVQLYDARGIPLIVDVGSGFVGGVKVTAIEATFGGGSVVGNGYQVNPVITVSPSMPTSTEYRATHFVRSNVVDQAENFVAPESRNEGAWGPETYAFIVNTPLVFAGLNTPNIFTGINEFQDVTTFSAPIDSTIEFALGDDGSTPRISESEGETLDYILLFESVWDGARTTRVYLRGGPTYGVHGSAGIAITENAYWRPGTSDWRTDDHPTPGFAVRTLFAGDHMEVARYSGATTFADSAWTTEKSTRWTSEQMRSTMLEADVPLLTSTRTPGSHPGVPTNLFKVLASFPTGFGNVRIYSGSDPVGEDAALLMTLNAAWDPITSMWSADSVGRAASILWFYGGTSVGASARFEMKAVTAAPWAAWDTGGGAGLADFNIGRVIAREEFLYETPKSGRHFVIPLSEAFEYNAGGTFAHFDMNDPSTDHAIAPITFNLGVCKVGFMFRLPEGAELEEVRVVSDSGDAGGSTVSAELLVSDAMDYGGGDPLGAGTVTSLDSDTETAAVRSFIALNGGGFSSDSDDTVFELTVYLTNALDILYGVRVQYTDPGPRN